MKLFSDILIRKVTQLVNNNIAMDITLVQSHKLILFWLKFRMYAIYGHIFNAHAQNNQPQVNVCDEIHT